MEISTAHGVNFRASASPYLSSSMLTVVMRSQLTHPLPDSPRVIPGTACKPSSQEWWPRTDRTIDTRIFSTAESAVRRE